jgi:hypothetical protein
VDVEVLDGLASVGAHVEDGPVAVLGDSFLAGDLCRRQIEGPEDPAVRLVDLVQGREVPPGNDQDVNRCLGLDVPERHDFLVLVDQGRGNLPAGDLAEQAVGIGHGVLRLGWMPPPIMLTEKGPRNVPSNHGAALPCDAPCSFRHKTPPPEGGTMEAILEAAEAVLRQDGAPALRLSELLRPVRARTRQLGLRADDLRRVLESDTQRFRVLDPWRGPWRHLEANDIPGDVCDPWVLVVRDPGGDGARPESDGPERRMGESVRWLGLGVDPLSPRDVSRWHCVALAERSVRGDLAKAA